MALSNAGRTLRVFLTGDTSGLDKALARANYKLKQFDKGAGGAATRGLGGGAFLGIGKGGLIAGGVGAAAVGLKSVVDAAKNAEVVLGQTSVAVGDAGLSWEKYGQQVQDQALKISNASAFDDEAVMQSFATFVRGQKDVGKSLTLAALAADVARGRYIDLESATMLVNKAAMGQTGALRRAGIQISKNATATEALQALTRAYGGAAESYSRSAAGAQDRLRVSIENLQESLGGGLLPVVTEFVNQLNDGVVAANKLGTELGKLNFSIPGGGSLGGALKDSLFLLPNALRDAFGSQPAQTSAGLTSRPDEGTRGPAPGPGSSQANRKPTPVEMRNKWFDQAISRRMDRVQDLATPAAQVKALQGIKADVQAQLAKTKDATRRLNLQDVIVGLNREIRGIWDDQAQAAADARGRAAQQAKDKAAKLTQAMTDFVDGLRSGLSDALSGAQGKVRWQRDLADAKDQLRLAKLIGDRGMLKDAQRAIVDAQFEQKQWLVDTAKIKATGAHSATIVINGMTINGVQNVQQLLAEINKAARRNTTQTRGRLSPTTLVH